MTRFRVTFRKLVYGNTGHPCDICQRIVEVDARDSGAAEAAAIAYFCEMENVTDWLNHADRLEIARVRHAPARQPADGDVTRHAA